MSANPPGGGGGLRPPPRRGSSQGGQQEPPPSSRRESGQGEGAAQPPPSTTAGGNGAGSSSSGGGLPPPSTSTEASTGARRESSVTTSSTVAGVRRDSSLASASLHVPSADVLVAGNTGRDGSVGLELSSVLGGSGANWGAGTARPSSISRDESNMLAEWARRAAAEGQESDDEQEGRFSSGWGKGVGKNRRKSVEMRAGELVPPVGVLHYSAGKGQYEALMTATPPSGTRGGSFSAPPFLPSTPGSPRSAIQSLAQQARQSIGGGGRMSVASRKSGPKPPSNPRDWPHCTEEALRERPYRRVWVNEEQEFAFASNSITTSKYTLWNFAPLFLFSSFHPKRKMANLYFLLLSIFQCVPQISNTFGIPTILLPLSIVILADAVFAALEDIRRHKADAAANSSPCLIFNPATKQFEKRTWVDIQAGDFLKIHNREIVPADVILVGVHEPEPDAPDGICYLETKSLDGETNLKLRESVECTVGRLKSAEDVGYLRGLVEMEHPNKLIDSFTGTLELCGSSTESGTTPLPPGWHVKEVVEPTSVLLRGCTVRNTDWAVGLVVNTGRDTKIMMSNVDPPLKSSSLTLQINVEIKRVVLLLVLVCCVGATGFTLQHTLMSRKWSYLDYPISKGAGAAAESIGRWATQFAYFFLLCGNFIPVSLYVSMSTVRFVQSYVVEWDLRMYHPPTDQHAEVRTMNLNEELGQVSHVFTDKTGTLTCNVMEFRKLAVGGRSYGLGVTEISKSHRKMAGVGLTTEELLAEAEGKKARAAHVNFYDPVLWEDLRHARRGKAQQEKLQQFFRLLAVCHSVIPEREEDTGETKFSASSPDDEALVCAARFFGFAFEGRREGCALVKNGMTGQIERYRVLEILEFTSARKRMSVIVEAEDGQILILAKGADTAMIPRLRPGQTATAEATLEHMKRYASEGLRTLMCCSATMARDAFARWYVEFERTAKDLAQIELRKSGKENGIDALMDKLEQNFELLGATAIEDKLQEGVPETIHDLSRAGIKVWMLTGDKEETAVNIGVACNLLEHPSKMRRITVNAEKCQTEHQVRYLLKHELQKFKDDWERHGHAKCKPRALIIDGATLALASREGVRRRLLKLTRICKSVVACRVSPDQKRSIVHLVKAHDPRCRALSIGDGANDVPMIQEAHVGVGIAGMEGMQAVNSSDFAISQFRFLAPLLLAHGRWNYRRMALIVAYIFYKNIMQSAAQFVFAFVNSFSGQKFFTEGSIQLYNVLFTTLPLLLLGMWDRDVKYETALKYPELYAPGIQSAALTTKAFWCWILAALVESVLCTLGPLYALQNATVNDRGQELSSFWEAGAISYTLILLVVTFKLALRQERWTKWNVLAYLVSVLAWFAVALCISSLIDVDYNWFGVFPTVMASPAVWLCMAVISAAIVAPDAFGLAYRRAFHPSLLHVLQALDCGLLKESPSLTYAIKAMQHRELQRVGAVGAADLAPPSVTRAGSTPMAGELRGRGPAGAADGTGLLVVGGGGGRKSAGFAFSADPITLEAERRKIMTRSARMAPLKDILDELALDDTIEFSSSASGVAGIAGEEEAAAARMMRLDSTEEMIEESSSLASGGGGHTTAATKGPAAGRSLAGMLIGGPGAGEGEGEGGSVPESPRIYREDVRSNALRALEDSEEGEEEGEGTVSLPLPAVVESETARGGGGVLRQQGSSGVTTHEGSAASTTTTPRQWEEEEEGEGEDGR